MNTKGAIELSANFIVVIIISMIILAGGIGIFFKLKASAQSYVDKLDGQTQDRLKSMMLSNNYKTAIFPSDPVIKRGDSQLIGIGITNIYDYKNTFYIKTSNNLMKYYAGPDATAQLATAVTPSSIPADFVNPLTGTTIGSITINPHDQQSKGVLLKMPKNAPKGQYVYTFNITNSSVNGAQYGILQVYISVP